MRILASESTVNEAPSQLAKRGKRAAAVRVPLFFAGLGAYFGVLSWMTLLVWHELTWEGGSGLMIRFSWEKFAILGAIIFAMLGTLVGLICSTVSVRRMRNKDLRHVALLLVPVHSVIVITLTVIFMNYLGWIIPLIASGSFVFLCLVVSPRFPNRHVPGYCDDCEYDLTGNVSGVCPECGRSIEPEEKTA